MHADRQIRCPVHGFIQLNADDGKIVATRVFQRLRGIKQLAFANLVYPGALHTRFDHTLGVYHIAQLMGEQFELGPSDQSLVRQAALLHDLGHGPFSHVSENVLERYADRAKLAGRIKAKEKIHELVTADIILTDAELGKLIAEERRERLVSLLTAGYGEPLLRDIISGPLDADKQDYLLRDSLFCGVRYGVFDLHQFHRSLCVGEHGSEKSLMIRPTGVHALEQFVLAKYYLTTQVYAHRVRLVTDHMLTRAVILGVEVDAIEELQQLYTYDGEPGFAQRYVEWDDAKLMLTYTADKFKGKYCHSLLTRLLHRRLLKQVFGRPVTKEVFPDEQVRGGLEELTRAVAHPADQKDQNELLAHLEEALSAAISRTLDNPVDPRLVILSVYTIKSVRVQSRDNEKGILVADRPQPVAFEEKSTLFKSIDERMDDTVVEVYAPVTYETEADKRKVLDLLYEPIMTTLHDHLKGEGV